MKRAVDTIIHDQAIGPVPADSPPPVPELATADVTDAVPPPANEASIPEVKTSRRAKSAQE